MQKAHPVGLEPTTARVETSCSNPTELRVQKAPYYSRGVAASLNQPEVENVLRMLLVKKRLELSAEIRP